jgi:hypothetical protein
VSQLCDVFIQFVVECYRRATEFHSVHVNQIVLTVFDHEIRVYYAGSRYLHVVCTIYTIAAFVFAAVITDLSLCYFRSWSETGRSAAVSRLE